ncbi:hypothetical protein HEMROJRC1_20390 [Rodentibacter sp. JRC1]|nr:hypothetical protein HEMROJRC1_20390 [Rodentibacter sp. JRC1]
MRLTGNYSESLLSTLKVREPQSVSRQKHKIHKEFTPKNITNTIKFSIGQKLVAPVAKHDINLNPYVRKLRKSKKQRLNVRDELEEMCKSVFPALIKHCEYSVYADCLFEIKAPLKQLALELGVLSKNGRYDRLNRLLEMMQEAGLAVVMHEFDQERYKQKAVRIFLLPDFFYSLGHTEESLKKMVASTNLHLIKKGAKKSLVERAQAHEKRLKGLNVANMQANPKNAEKYALLQRAKVDFLNDKAFRNLENKRVKFDRQEDTEQSAIILPDMPLTLEELAYFATEKQASKITLTTPPIDPGNQKRRIH